MRLLERMRPQTDHASTDPIRRIAHSGATTFFVFVLAAGLGYVSQLMLARTIGIEGFGDYNYVMAWTTVLAYVSASGFDVALLRFVPAYREVGDWSRLKGVLNYAHARVNRVSAILIGTLLVILAARPQLTSMAMRAAVWPGLALVPVLALLWIRCAALRGLGAFLPAVTADRVLREAGVICLVAIAVYGFGIPIGAPAAMMITLTASLAGLGVASFALARARPSEIKRVIPARDAPAWRLAALVLVGIGATEVLFNRSGTLWFGWTGDTRSAGIYSLVFNISFFVALPRTAVNTLFAPTLAGAFARKDQSLVQHLIARSTLWTACTATAIAAALFVLAEPLLGVFGPDFATGVPALRILLVGQLAAAAAGSQLHVLTMTGNERAAGGLLIAAAVTCLVCTCVLAERWGLDGAAAAMSASLALWNVLMALFIWRRLHLLPGIAVLVLGSQSSVTGSSGLTSQIEISPVSVALPPIEQS